MNPKPINIIRRVARIWAASDGGFYPVHGGWRCSPGRARTSISADFPGIPPDGGFFHRFPAIDPGLEMGKTGRLDDHRRHGSFLSLRLRLLSGYFPHGPFFLIIASPGILFRSVFTAKAKPIRPDMDRYHRGSPIDIRKYKIDDAAEVGLLIKNTYSQFNLNYMPMKECPPFLGPFQHADNPTPEQLQAIQDMIWSEVVLVSSVPGKSLVCCGAGSIVWAPSLLALIFISRELAGPLLKSLKIGCPGGEGG